MSQRIDRRTVLAAGLSAGLIAASCQRITQKMDAQVIILGAGLSGLQAARMLSDDGYDVLVLEASKRIGGRLHTLTHLDGRYTEGGGEQIGASYARIIDAAQNLGIPLTPDNAPPSGTTYHYNDVLYSAQDWKTLGPTGGRSPASLFFGAAAKANPLSAAQDWRDPAFAAFDIDAQTFLKQAGLPDDQITMINQTANCNALSTYSMMNVYRSLQLYSQSRGMGQSLSVAGGAQRLPEAMAASLARDVTLGAKVISIEETSDHVTVTTHLGETYRAPHLVCALPFGALGDLKIKAPLTKNQRAYMKVLPYTQILQIHFRTQTPFWERDGLPVNMTTDGPLERLFGTPAKDGKPNGLFRFWINGTGASALSTLSDDQLYDLASKELARIRPASGGDIKGLKVVRWLRSNKLAGGAYMHFAPSTGSIGSMAKIMGAPTPRIQFAGEHLSYLHTGMEGAMESGEAAAFAILGA